MAKEKIENAIILNDDSIIDWKPLEDGYIQNPLIQMCGALTEIKKYFGYDKFQINEGGYKLTGNVSIYLIDLVRFNRDNISIKRIKPRLMEEIFFTGGLQVFKEDIIPGTNLNGVYSISNGRIWFAKKILKKLDYSFCNYVFGNKKSNNRIEIIEKIVRGYWLQEKNKDLENRNRVYDAYRKGSCDIQEEIFGTFGGR